MWKHFDQIISMDRIWNENQVVLSNLVHVKGPQGWGGEFWIAMYAYSVCSLKRLK